MVRAGGGHDRRKGPAVPHERLSLLAVIPDDVTDPLLWRLALDVIAAHQPNDHGNCRNLQCANHRAMCPAARAARRAMNLARPARPASAPPAPRRPQGRRAVTARQPGIFRGWFATTPAPSRPVAGLPQRQALRRPMPDASAA